MLRTRALAHWLGMAFLGACLFAAPEARADEPQPRVRFDPDALPPPSTQTRLILLGSAVTALTYGGAVGASYIWESDPGATDLRIPVVGPWIKLGHTTLCPDEDTSCNNAFQVVGALVTALDGLGQLGGLGLLAEGIFAPSTSKRAVRGTAGLRARGGTFSSHLILETAGFTFMPVPFVQGGSDAGLAIVGTF